jgi:hypothetical protein
MGTNWFLGVTLVAMIASAVACNAILGIQDLPPGSGSTSKTPEPLDGDVPVGGCQGLVYKVETGDACGCTNRYYVLCDDTTSTFQQCSCAVPVGYVPYVPLSGFEGGFPGDEAGFEGGLPDDEAGFEAGFPDDEAGFEAGFPDVVGFGDDADELDAGSLDF